MPGQLDGASADQALDDDPDPGMAAASPPVRRLRIGRPSTYVAALTAVAVAVAFVGGLTYFGAREFSGRAADARGSEEAASLAKLSAHTATGDAFNGYLQILRYADDPVVRAPIATREQRVSAMKQLLYLNTNRLESLAVVTRQGIVLASTDDDIAGVPDSEAFKRTRANLSPTNSDIVLPDGDPRGYVEFTAPLKDPAGAVWAILYGRADPDTLWQQTLRTSVDGSHNVIINAEGQFSAGVPEGLLRQPWKGVPLPNGSVRAQIVGIESICGLGPIGRDTQIDHGWNVASCLPASLVQAEASSAMGRQGLVTLAGCVLALVFAAGLLRVAIPGAPAPASQRPVAAAESWEAAVEAAVAPIRAAAVQRDEVAAAPPAGPTGAPEDPRESADQAAAEPAVQEHHAPHGAQIALIDAFERRNARLSLRLRETVQARLLIATAQAEEAFRRRNAGDEAAEPLHTAAMRELEDIRDRELRALGQELHPGHSRLGLGSAIRALGKEFDASMTVSIDIDPRADAIGGRSGRLGVDDGRRTVVLRAVRDALAALAGARVAGAHIFVRREGDVLQLGVEGSGAEGAVDVAAMAAAELSMAAYGGAWTLAAEGAGVSVMAELPAPGIPVEDDPYVPTEDDDDADEDEPADAAPPAYPSAHVVTFAVPSEDDGRPLADAIRELARDLAGHIEVTLDLAEAYDDARVLEPVLAAEIRALVSATVRGLAAAGAPGCSVSLYLAGDEVELAITSESADGFDDAPSRAAAAPLEVRGGRCTVTAHDGGMSLAASVSRVAHAPEDVPAVVRVERLPGDIEIEDDEPAA